MAQKSLEEAKKSYEDSFKKIVEVYESVYKAGG